MLQASNTVAIRTRESTPQEKRAVLSAIALGVGGLRVDLCAYVFEPTYLGKLVLGDDDRLAYTAAKLISQRQTQCLSHVVDLAICCQRFQCPHEKIVEFLLRAANVEVQHQIV